MVDFYEKMFDFYDIYTKKCKKICTGAKKVVPLRENFGARLRVGA